MRVKGVITTLICLTSILSLSNVKTNNEPKAVLGATNNNSLYQEIDNDIMIKAMDHMVTILEYDRMGNYYGMGSGILIDEDDTYHYILTNNHVIADGATFEVISHTYERKYGTVLGADSIQDVAVVRVEKFKDVTLATLGDSDTVKVGDEIFAIGSPGDYSLKETVTKGIVGGLDRCASESVQVLEEQKHAIQVDLAINPGNSGGALFNAKGEVIGVNTLKLTTDGNDNVVYEAINLALPINDMILGARRIMASTVYNANGSIVQKGSYIKSSLGTAFYKSMRDVTLYDRQQLKVPIQVYKGVLITYIEGSLSNPLFNADIPTYSIIEEVDGVKVDNKVQLRREIYKKEIGSYVQLKVLAPVEGEYQETIYLVQITRAKS